MYNSNQSAKTNVSSTCAFLYTNEIFCLPLCEIHYISTYSSSVLYTLCLCGTGGGGLTASWRAAAGEGARLRGAGGFIAVARAVAKRRSRTITDGDNLLVQFRLVINSCLLTIKMAVSYECMGYRP